MSRPSASGKGKRPGDRPAALDPRTAPPDPDPARVDAIFARFSATEPAPVTELAYETPFGLLVAVVLSAQATDVSVNRATPALFARGTTPQAMLELGEAGVRACIRTIGLFNTKARNVIALSQTLIDLHEGEVPRTRAALQALPGVGPKTAAVVLNNLWGEPSIAVDTHVFRVSHRLGLSQAPTPHGVEAALTRLVPEGYRRHAHHWLILHGRYVCTARRPQCPRCLIADLCPFADKTPAPASAPERPAV